MGVIMDIKTLNEAMNRLKVPRNRRQGLLANIRKYNRAITPEQREQLKKNLDKYEKIFYKELTPYQAGLIISYWRGIANKKAVKHIDLILEVEKLPFTLTSPPIRLKNTFKALKIQKKIREAMEAE